jgi:hypothetical protein
MARVSKKSAVKRSSAKTTARTKTKTAAKRSSAGKPRRKTASSSVTKQVKNTTMKVLAGAASGAVQALIPTLEDAAGRSAKTAGMDTPGQPRATQPRK